MVNEETYMKFGLIKDEENLRLKEVFKNNVRLKETHIDIYPDNPLIKSSAPFMLLLRAVERDILIINDDNRLILKRRNDENTCLMNVLFSEITDCYCNISESYTEFIFKIQNTYYKITIFN